MNQTSSADAGDFLLLYMVFLFSRFPEIAMSYFSQIMEFVIICCFLFRDSAMGNGCVGHAHHKSLPKSR
jgi:hypothetical protein